MKDKPHCSGTMTDAALRSFVMSALRRMRWAPKYECIKHAFVEHGINPATGRKCKLHKCVHCVDMNPQTSMQADHIEPVVPIDGCWGDTTRWLGYNWNELLPRLLCERDGFQALCKGCHKEKTAQEREARRRGK